MTKARPFDHDASRKTIGLVFWILQINRIVLTSQKPPSNVKLGEALTISGDLSRNQGFSLSFIAFLFQTMVLSTSRINIVREPRDMDNGSLS